MLGSKPDVMSSSCKQIRQARLMSHAQYVHPQPETAALPCHPLQHNTHKHRSRHTACSRDLRHTGWREAAKHPREKVPRLTLWPLVAALPNLPQPKRQVLARPATSRAARRPGTRRHDRTLPRLQGMSPNSNALPRSRRPGPPACRPAGCEGPLDERHVWRAAADGRLQQGPHRAG